MTSTRCRKCGGALTTEGGCPGCGAGAVSRDADTAEYSAVAETSSDGIREAMLEARARRNSRQLPSADAGGTGGGRPETTDSGRGWEETEVKGGKPGVNYLRAFFVVGLFLACAGYLAYRHVEDTRRLALEEERAAEAARLEWESKVLANKQRERAEGASVVPAEHVPAVDGAGESVVP